MSHSLQVLYSKVERMAHKQHYVNQNGVLGHRFAQNIKVVLGERDGFSFTGADAMALRSPCVYMWLRDDHVLYVGMSSRGAERPFSPRHKHLEIQPTDELWIWPVGTEQAAREAERLCVEAFQPTFNKQRSYGRYLLSAKLGVSQARAAVLKAVLSVV